MSQFDTLERDYPFPNAQRQSPYGYPEAAFPYLTSDRRSPFANDYELPGNSPYFGREKKPGKKGKYGKLGSL